MTEGSCLCGTVRFAVDAELTSLSHCHCSMCRKAHGAPFATYADAPVDAFRWTAGERSVRRFESSPGFHRTFCGECGSVLPGPVADGKVFVPVGLLDGEVAARPMARIFADDAPAWHPATADLPCHAAYGPDTVSPSVTREALPRGETGVVRGSCLCGDVAFEVVEPFKVVHNCHCSRCRKARAAAHTTNGFTSFDGVRFVRGEALVEVFKLPSAQFFTQAFCRRCGSGVPRKDPGRGIAVIPLGSLDDEPSGTAVDHIFTGSMAGWYTIPDGLPRFEEGPV